MTDSEKMIEHAAILAENIKYCTCSSYEVCWKCSKKNSCTICNQAVRILSTLLPLLGYKQEKEVRKEVATKFYNMLKNELDMEYDKRILKIVAKEFAVEVDE